MTPVEQNPLLGTPDLLNLAMVYARTDEPHLALRTLDALLDMPALISIELLELDPRWSSIVEHDEFRRLKKKYG